MKSPMPAPSWSVARAAGGDAVVHQQAAGLEQAVDLARSRPAAGPADVLEHADRGDLVERLGLRQLAVVAQLHRARGRCRPRSSISLLTCACWFFDSVMPCASTP